MVTNITTSVTYTVYRMFQYYVNGEFGFSVFLWLSAVNRTKDARVIGQ